MPVRITPTLILLLASTGAFAQSPAANAVAAKKLFMEGKAKFEEQKPIEALASFQESLRLVSRHSTVLFIGHCYRLLKRPDKALERYQEFLDMVEQRAIKVEASVVDDVRALAGTQRAVLDLVDEGKLKLEQGRYRDALADFQQARDQIPWAEIHRWIAICQQKLKQPRRALAQARLAVGAYQGYLSSWSAGHPESEPPDHEEIRRALATAVELQTKLEAELARGQVRLVGLPAEAAVMVDGARRGTGPMSDPLELAVGAHRLEVSARGFRRWERTVDVSPGRLVTVSVQLRPVPPPVPPPRPRSKAWLVTTIAMAVVSLGAEGMAWAAWGKSTTVASTDSSFGTLGSLTVVGHVLAGTFALATGASYFMYERSGGPPDDRGTPGAGSNARHGAWMVSGSFDL